MKRIVSKKFVASFVAVGICLLAQKSFAASYYKFCTKWTRTYVDAGYGETYFNSSASNVQTAAMFSRFEIREGSVYSNPVMSGFLDGAGCMWTGVEVDPNTTYYFTQGTWAKYNTREVWVNTDAGDDFNSTINWYTHSFETSSYLSPGYTYTHTFNTVFPSSKANIMPVAGQIVSESTLLGMPANTLSKVRTDIDACTMDGGYYNLSGEICVVADGGIYGWGDVTTFKFVTAHEFGHLTADERGVTTGGSYDDNPSQSKCKCDHIGTYGDSAHCLQSREHSEDAIAEGFAHFFATAVFNPRTENAGRFVYPKPMFAKFGDFWTSIGPPSPTNAYHSDPAESSSDRWMEKFCNPGDAAKGVELDWLRFFNEVWTSGVYKFSSEEILDVLDDVTDPYYGWDNNNGSLEQTVESQWGPYSGEANLFRNKGDQTGVNHG